MLFVFCSCDKSIDCCNLSVSICVCVSTYMWLKTKLLFDLITHSTAVVETYVSLIVLCVCQPSSLQFTMSYSGAYSHQVGIGYHRRTTGTSGIQSLGNSPGQYSMQASARETGSYLSHRPRLTHLENPATATAIRYGSRAQSSFRSSEVRFPRT